MPLGNYVKLVNNVPERIHFYDHYLEKRTIANPVTGKTEIKNVAIMRVDRLNGVVVDTELSTLSENLYGQLEPYLKDKGYLKYDFVITQRGDGFGRKWTVQTIPLH